MATRYRFGDSQYPHFITFAVINWIDAFSRPIYKDIIVNSLKHCQQEKGLIINGLKQNLNYLHDNPVRAGIVYETWHDTYSSAIDYCTTEKGKIDLELV